MPPEILALIAAGVRMDAAETAFAQRALIDLETEVQRTPRAPLEADQLIPLDPSVNPGATHWGFRRVEATGEARPMGTRGGDMPMVAISEVETLVQMHSFGLGFDYSMDEMRAAVMAKAPLAAERAVACRDGHYATRDRVAMEGHAGLGIPGFVASSLVPVGAVTNGTWATATADDIAEDVTNEIEAVESASRRVYRPTTIALPYSAWNDLTRRRIPDTETPILDYLKKIRPGIEFVPSTYLETAGVGGVRRMVTYVRRPDVLVQKASILYQQLAPQPKGLIVTIPAESKWGGTYWKVPIAGKYGDGI